MTARVHNPLTVERTQLALGSRCIPGRLLSRTGTSFNSDLPETSAIPDLIGPISPIEPEAGSSKGPQTNLANGFFVFAPRGGQYQALSFAMQDADGETASGILVGYRPITADDLGPNDRVVYRPQVLETFNLVAGTRTGVAGGLLDNTWRDADTITITQTFRPQPEPERIIGPKDVGDFVTLSPDNTPATLLVDNLGFALFGLYLKCGTAAAVTAIEWPL